MKNDLKLNNRPDSKVYIVILIIILAGLSWVSVFPKIGQITSTYKTLKTDKARLVALESKSRDLESLDAAELLSRNELALKALPLDKNTINAMTTINTISNNNGILLDSIRVSPGSVSATASGEKGLGKISFDVILVGNFEQAKYFINELSRNLPIIEPNNLAIDLVMGRFSLKLESYYLYLPETIGKIDAIVPKLTAKEEELLQKYANLSFNNNAIFYEKGGKLNPFGP